MVTIYDIAAKAGVSAMTVSRMINNPAKISEKTRAKVQRVMDELGYVPNQTARNLVLQQSRTLFLLITDITNPFYTTIARGAEDAAKQFNYQLLFGNSDASLEKEKDYINTILSTRADGVLIAPAGDDSLPHLEALRKYQIPFVLLDREVPGVETDLVLGNGQDAARQLVVYLAQHGHERIAMINGSSRISSARERLQGYKEALQHNNLPIRPNYVLETAFEPRNDLSDIAAWLDTMDPSPTAIFAGNSVLAIEVMRTLKQRNKYVPTDLSLVCFDDLGPFSEINPFMTVVSQQAYQFGYQGTKLLIERLQERDESHKQPWRKIILPAELIIRHSVQPPNHPIS